MTERPTNPLPPPTGVAISPAPTDEEAAAIITAAEALTPPAAPPEAVDAPRSRSWRFSGRWWARPVAARRERPFR